MSTQTNGGDWIVPESAANVSRKIANILYLSFGVLFFAGLYFDWQYPGNVVVAPFSVVKNPYPNSGLFVAAILVMVVGYAFGKAGEFIEEKNKAEFDQTQEWTVDIEGLSSNSQNDG